jgi:hypothetical protein
VWASQQDSANDVAQPTAAKSRTPSSETQSHYGASGTAAPTPDKLPGNAAESTWAVQPREEWRTPADAELAAWAPPPPPPPPPAPPAPPPASPAPPPPPAAPAFPYQLIGSLTEDGIPQALIAGPNRTLAAKAGDVIDGQWKVERVDTNGMALLWQPGQLKQTVSFKPLP